MFQTLVSFIVTVAGGVITGLVLHYLIKWLDSDD